MLELRKYTFRELSAILGTTDKQGLNRKLQRYDIQFRMEGNRAPNIVYEIISTPDPFKIHCITKMGISAQTDFTKLRNLYFYFFCDVDFSSKSYTEMEATLRDECGDGEALTRGAISRRIRHLDRIGYIHISRTDFTYYAIRKTSGGQKIYTEIAREVYANGWKTYFQLKEEHGAEYAYCSMRNIIGGHPYKKPKIDQNAIYSKEIDELIDAINNSFLSQTIDAE